MPTFAFYLLKVVLCSAVLYGYYQLFLRNKVYHVYNRFYLLTIVVVALLAPLLNFTMLYGGSDAVGKPIQLLQVVNSGDEYLEEIIIYSHRSHISSSQVLMLLYTLVSLVLLGVFIKMLAFIFRILKTGSSRNIQEIVFVESDAKGTPFSFFKFIFWNKAIDVHSQTGRQIFAHELAHVKEKHSIDKLFLNLVLIFCWINPFFWLIKKELNLIHEFIADKKAVEDNDASALAAMIVTSAYPKHSYLLTNHFFYSPIKRRLQMLSKYNSTKAGYFYRILALPVVLFFIAAFTIKTKAGIENMLNPAKKITVVIDAGHGGHDGGATGLDGSLEKDLNLSFLKRIKELNKSSNIELVFTRETDIYQTPKEKAAIATNAGADLFISIHSDVSPNNAQETGLKIYVSNDQYPNSPASKLFASSVISQFRGNYALAVFPNPMQRKVGIFVLQANDIPSILVQPGYISNSKDLAYLQTAKAKDDFAKNILSAIAQYADNMKQQLQATQSLVVEKARDTLPATSKTLGSYKGEEIKKVSVSTDCEVVELMLNNGKRVSMSYNEAVKQQIKLPAKNVAVKSTVSEVIVTGYEAKQQNPDNKERVVIGYKTNPANAGSQPREVTVEGYRISQQDNPSDKKHPLIVLDGKEIPNADLKDIDAGTIESVNVLKGEKAISKYGAQKAADGVIEINTKNSLKEVVVIKTPLQSGEKIFTKLEQEPEFPGGASAWQKYLREHLNANIPVDEGWSAGVFKVMVRFIVDQDGNIHDIVAENYAGTKTAQECIDLIKNGPKWIPGKQNGKTVTAYRKQPITFVIQEQ